MVKSYEQHYMGDEKVFADLWELIRIVSFQMQLPRIWNLLVGLPWVNVFPIDLQCSNAGGGRGYSDMQE